MRRLRIILWILSGLAALLLVGILYTGLQRNGGERHADQHHGSDQDQAIAPAPQLDFSLIDDQGRRRTPADFDGKYLLVFFGFTHCPDICPATLAQIDTALALVGPRADKIQALFITVDPERDNPAVLDNYLAGFESGIIGLTGTLEEIKAAARNFGIYFAKRPAEADGSYLVDHTSAVFLAAPDGRYLDHARTQDGADAFQRMIEQQIPSP